MLRNDKEKKLFVVGYNKCLFTMLGSHPKFLSKPLLAFVNNNQYDGFYGCTSIAQVRLDDLQDNKKSHLPESSHGSERQLKENYKTYQITENFINATQRIVNRGTDKEHTTILPCLAISTVDDMAYVEGNRADVCGRAYNDFIKPYESTGELPYSGENLELKEVWQHMPYDKAKNEQLFQIAHHAVKAFPGATISLDFVDDSKNACDRALLASDRSDWPKNVKLNVFHHNPVNDEAPVIPVTQVGQIIKRRATTGKYPGLLDKPAANNRVAEHQEADAKVSRRRRLK